MVHIWLIYGKYMASIWLAYSEYMVNIWLTYGLLIWLIMVNDNS